MFYWWSHCQSQCNQEIGYSGDRKTGEGKWDDEAVVFNQSRKLPHPRPGLMMGKKWCHWNRSWNLPVEVMVPGEPQQGARGVRGHRGKGCSILAGNQGRDSWLSKITPDAKRKRNTLAFAFQSSTSSYFYESTLQISEAMTSGGMDFTI